MRALCALFTYESPLAQHVTISVGVAALVGSGEASAEQLVAAADRAMYAAKAGGRDRVAWSAQRL